MSPAPSPQPPPARGGGVEQEVWEARKLLRAARVATLASSAQGQPFASLVTPACAPDLSLLLLLSELSEHTRHLHAEPRCSVLVVGEPESANPQTAPRITVTGVAERLDDPALKSRYLAVHPYAAMYAGFGDFALWRIRRMGGLFVGGFARARRLRAADLVPDAAAVAAVAAAEPAIIEHCNAEYADALARVAARPGRWRLVTVDTDGCDLAQGDHVIRMHWSKPVADADEVRGELARLARAATAG
jgi:heme iron utilization protein